MTRNIEAKSVWSFAKCICLIMLISFALDQCAHAQAEQSKTIVLTGAGATFPASLYMKWFDEYRQKTGVQVDYEAIGSGGGIKQITAKSVDFGASDRPLDKAEIAAAHGIVAAPMTIGSVAIIYNIPGVDMGLRLTPDIVAGIYLGKITYWNDSRIQAINPQVKLPHIAILPMHKSAGDGATGIFMKWLSLNSAEWKTRVGSAPHMLWPVGLGPHGSVSAAIVAKENAGSICYETYPYTMQLNIHYASIRNRSGHFMLPSVEAGTAAAKAPAFSGFPRDIVGTEPADGYPLCFFTYILFYSNGKPELKAFIRWALTDAVQDEAAMNYSPLSPNVTREALAAVGSDKE